MLVERIEVLTPDGIRLACTDTGGGDVPAMVVLHALGEGTHHWTPVMTRFAEHLRVIALDLRGHGCSDWPGRYSLRLMVNDVLAVLDELGLGAVTVVGHSLGGAVAYLMAMNHPERVDRLVVEDAAPPFPRDRAVPERPS